MKTNDRLSASDHVARLEAQIAGLNQTVALLRAQLADMRAHKDRWESRADRISLTALY
jgi:hypothetical protein